MELEKLQEIEKEVTEIKKEFHSLIEHSNLKEKKKELEELEKIQASPEFWQKSQDEVREVNQRIKALKGFIDDWQKLEEELQNTETLIELLQEAEDEELSKELEKSIGKLNKDFRNFRIKILLGEEFDYNNCYLNIHPGAGGTESCDWAQMLYRMYIRWIEKKGFNYKVIDFLPGEVAGIKNVTLLVEGSYAYGFLKGEKGIHRLVRISPFDANSRRHTSFAAVDVFPEISDEIEVEINEADLRIDTFRSSGAGGQHVNVTDSAVRITHLPTGIVVSCQNERSQHANRLTAMKMLKAKLYERLKAEKDAEMEKIAGEKKDISWGNQIRSYVFHPYNMVKDLRTGEETGNVQAVMDGELDNFIEAYLKYNAARKEGK